MPAAMLPASWFGQTPDPVTVGKREHVNIGTSRMNGDGVRGRA